MESSVDPPAAPVGDAGELLDVDVGQLAGPFALVSARRLSVRRSVTAVKAAEIVSMQDRLHRRRGKLELVTDVVGAPTMPTPQRHHMTLNRQRGLIRRPMWPTGSVL